MSDSGLNSFIRTLELQGELIRIGSFVDPELEITEVADRISKQEGGGKAILFENTGTDFPLLINALGSERRISTAFGRKSLEEVEKEIENLFLEIMQPRESLWDKLRILPRLKEFSQWMPRKLKRRGICQEVVMEKPGLSKLPVLKCWPADGGPFITLPGVHTVDPESGNPNVGMYRMQVFEDDMTGMHWHKHKTGAVHFEKYKKLGKKMPVSVSLGGDPVYTYAATAPMPENIDEYLLAGFLRKKPVRLVKCLTNDLYVPEDADFVIEGYVDPEEELVWEGPFGDHTGFYSLADWYPKFHITCITHKKEAVYPATIVGVPPMEDAWIGLATERIFLTPIRMSMVPELIDMKLPVAGVAHNFTVAKIDKTYAGQAIKVMHSLWGAGQMMFNKVLVVVDKETDIHDNDALISAFKEYFHPDHCLHFSKGPLDVLDHSSQQFAYGSKLGIDLTRPLPEERMVSDSSSVTTQEMKFRMEEISEITGIEMVPSVPVLLLNIRKDNKFNKKKLANKLGKTEGVGKYKAVFLFHEGAPLDDYFTLLWLLGGNLEPLRDISFLNAGGTQQTVLVDATFKTGEHDNFTRDWPNVVTMDDKTIVAIDRKWNELKLGEFTESPSRKFKALIRGDGAVREQAK